MNKREYLEGILGRENTNRILNAFDPQQPISISYPEYACEYCGDFFAGGINKYGECRGCGSMAKTKPISRYSREEFEDIQLPSTPYWIDGGVRTGIPAPSPYAAWNPKELE